MKAGLSTHPVIGSVHEKTKRKEVSVAVESVLSSIPFTPLEENKMFSLENFPADEKFYLKLGNHIIPLVQRHQIITAIQHLRLAARYISSPPVRQIENEGFI